MFSEEGDTINVGGDLFSLDTDGAPPSEAPVVEIKPVAPSSTAKAPTPSPTPVVSAPTKSAPLATKAPVSTKAPLAAKPISAPVKAAIPGARTDSRVCFNI
jgi:pyruvate/2-oxoglutarate dehydrogenase complex dihydrolipoamide acyltransferase (E2) component